jgi:1-acyl-sn-glycerol-3-phosphate acyltransferase
MKEAFSPIRERGVAYLQGAFSLVEKYSVNPILDRQKAKLSKSLTERLTKHFANPLNVEGIENVRQTQELNARGKKIITISNHLSYADFPVTMAALKENGLDAIAENTIPIEGLRLGKDPMRRFLANGYKRIIIWPRSLEPKNEEERKKQFRMNFNGLKEARSKIENGYPLIYPEGSRSRTQALERGIPESLHFITLADFVLPIGICGTEKILPVGAKLPKKHQATVTFGLPISVNEAKRQYEHIADKESRRQMIVDYLMYRIADCLPPKYRGVYANET